jgi:hypothetical protein
MIDGKMFLLSHIAERLKITYVSDDVLNIFSGQMIRTNSNVSEFI